MKKYVILILAVVLGSAFAIGGDRDANDFQFLKLLNGTPTYLGTIVATPAVRDNYNSDGGLFTITTGSMLMVQCDAAAFVYPAKTLDAGTLGTTGARAVRIDANEKYYGLLLTTDGFLQVAAVAGTVNCKVWRMR